MDLQSRGKLSSHDDIKVVFESKKSTENDVEVVLELKNDSTKDSSQDPQKISLLNAIGSFLGLSCTTKLNDDRILTGISLFGWLKEWFPYMDHEFLKGIAESQAVRNCQASLTDLYNSICTGPLGDHSISTESNTTIDTNSILSGDGITSNFPYIRLRLPPDSLVSEQQRQNTFEIASLSDMLLDNLYRYAENFYLKRNHIKTYCGSTCTCNHLPLSDTHNIERIDFIKHPKLFKEYEEVKLFYRSSKIPINEKLLFHGTHATNLNKILDDNFKVTADPVSRKKVNAYGKGIYLSDFPGQSIKYGEVLLLCKVILGKEEVNQIGLKPSTTDEFFQSNFNSRKIVDSMDNKDAPAKIYMVPSPRQILPCYVIYLKKKHRKIQPLQGSCNNILGFLNHPLQKAIQYKPTQSSKGPGISNLSIRVTSYGGPTFFVPSLDMVCPIEPHLAQIGHHIRVITRARDPSLAVNPAIWRQVVGVYIQVSNIVKTFLIW